MAGPRSLCQCTPGCGPVVARKVTAGGRVWAVRESRILFLGEHLGTFWDTPGRAAPWAARISLQVRHFATFCDTPPPATSLFSVSNRVILGHPPGRFLLSGPKGAKRRHPERPCFPGRPRRPHYVFATPSEWKSKIANRATFLGRSHEPGGTGPSPGRPGRRS